MPRRASLEIDLGLGQAPATWDAGWVRYRVVEAYSIERRLPGGRRAATAGGSWPVINYEFADVVGWTDARDRVFEDWARTSGSVFASDIARMEQAHDWLRLYLANNEVERLCLSSWAAAVAYHKSLSALLVRKRWSRTTFYKRASVGAFIIAMALEAKGEPVT